MPPISLSIRDCSHGEVYDENTNTCTECLPGESLIVDSKGSGVSECSACELTKMICNGGSEVGVQDGFWRMNSTANLIFRCPDPEGCLGSSVEKYRFGGVKVSSTGTCTDIYQGNMCNACKEGYGKSNDGSECLECSKDPRVYLQILSVLFFVGILVATTTRTTLKLEETKGPA
mmetsp:Transcript_9253/g.8124  ORF Transcript_9253/g.8124 Transcript_9253/m.8124 type:complete len:174 (+) Transcript_9253:476-997(+)